MSHRMMLTSEARLSGLTDRSGAPGHPAQDPRPGFAGGRKEIPMKRDLRGLYLLLVLLAASFAFGKFQGGFVPWFLFYVTLSLTLYVAAVALGALRKVEVARELSSKRLTAGETPPCDDPLPDSFPLSPVLAIFPGKERPETPPARPSRLRLSEMPVKSSIPFPDAPGKAPL